MNILVNTAYLPPAIYVSLAAVSSGVIVEMHETYRKQTCRNHCVVYGPNGRQTLTIPVLRVNGNHTLTRDILVSEHEPWQRIHWRSILAAYSNSPFFLYYRDRYEPFFIKPARYLADFNREILETTLDILKIGPVLEETTTFKRELPGTADFRDILVSKGIDKKTPRIRYAQPFEPAHGFIPGLSILDVVFNLGPEAGTYLKRLYLSDQNPYTLPG